MNRRLQVLIGAFAVAGGLGVGLLVGGSADQAADAGTIETLGGVNSVRVGTGRFQTRLDVPGLARPERKPKTDATASPATSTSASPAVTTTPATPSTPSTPAPTNSTTTGTIPVD